VQIWRPVAPVVLVGFMLAACGLARPQPSARFVREIPWAATGEWIAVDTHVHTRFSDGSHTVADVVLKAREFGCSAIAITDHADRRLRAATPAYRADIEAARVANADMVILAGLEWNVPPAAGDEHATVLVPPGPSEWDTLSEFKTRFDHYDRVDKTTPDAAEALRWLAGRGESGVLPVVIYNHPSRKDAAPLANVADLEAWRAVNDLVVGFEGAPGHQRDNPIGSYDAVVKTVDRWDPVAADVGGAWDTLLGKGLDVHGALAGSDFHNANPRDLHDTWPCEFAETWLRVSEMSAGGVLQALRAGSAFAVHGRIVREVELSVQAAGLPRAARAGEVTEVPPGATVAATVRMIVPDRDWQGQPNRVDLVEFVLVTPVGTTASTRPVDGRGQRSVSINLPVGAAGAVVRARGRRVVDDGPDLVFYTNGIRVRPLGGR
jgi:hypothetical protein